MPHPSTSSAYGIWSLNEVRDAVRGENWPTTEILWSVDVSNLSYDSVSFSVNSQEAGPSALAFNDDGTKLYIVGSANDTVYQYSLSTAFDISTTSYDAVSFSIGSQETAPQEIAFNTDGTKMYIMGRTGDDINQYSLSTAFDISTASFDSVTFSVATQESAPNGFAFNPDGTRLFVVGQTSDSVFQYSLATAFDISTASYDSVSLSISAQEAVSSSIAFNPEGTRMYITGSGSDNINQYSLSTGFDLSTASFDNLTFSVAAQESAPFALAFNTEGTKMYIVGSGSVSIHQYSTGL